MLTEYTFEVGSEAEARAKCLEMGLAFVRIAPLVCLPSKANALEVRGRYYAVGTKEAGDGGVQHAPHAVAHETLAAPPAQCPGRGCGVLIDGNEPHAKDCTWWNAQIEAMSK